MKGNKLQRFIPVVDYFVINLGFERKIEKASNSNCSHISTIMSYLILEIFASI